MPYKDPVIAKQYHDGYRDANREKNRGYQKAYRLRNRDRLRVMDRSRQRVKTHGISNEHWNELFEWQGSCCACCKTTDPGGPNGWHTDHDHDTMVIRGILCFRCNKLLGFMGDNAERVVASADRLLHYLSESGDMV